MLSVSTKRPRHNLSHYRQGQCSRTKENGSANNIKFWCWNVCQVTANLHNV